MLHATGGLGEVWLASDRHLGREVAVKTLRPDCAGRSSLVARFLDEARINGHLEHPGIVPVYDLVETPESGTPFYTMRFVRGRTLSEAVAAFHGKRRQGAASPIDLRGLLDAFVAVCHAVAYAHAQRVLHRDLKGQNIILGDFGEVFLLDWGVARPFDRDLPDGEAGDLAVGVRMSSEATLPGQILGTPSYMAPEQASAGPVDERSDVYGLGAILYLILTGRAPFAGGDTRAILQRVREETPERPRSLVASTPPALEAICRKAMAREPSARYGSASELADEVRRWLADEPVAAYPEPWSDRLRRWARRHRPLVAGAAALLVTATIALAVSNALVRAEQQRTEQARLQADGNLTLARRAVDSILLGVAQTNLPNTPGAEALRQRVAETASSLYSRFLRSSPDDPALQTNAATAALQIGTIYRQMDRFAEAARQFDQAIGLLEGQLAANPTSVTHGMSLAEVLIEYAVVRRMEGKVPDEVPYLVRAVEVIESIPPTGSDRIQPERIQARALAMLATAYRETDRAGEALEPSRKAIALMEALPTSPRPLEYFDRIFASSTLAPILRALERPEEAVATARAHRAMTGGYLDQAPENNDRRFLHALALEELAECLAVRPGDRAEAEALSSESIALIEPLTREFAGLPMYRLELARVRTVRAGLRADGGNVAAAREDAQAARDLLGPLLESTPEAPVYHAALGRSLALLGRLAIDGDGANPGPASDLLDQALNHTRRALQANPRSPRDRETLRQIEADRTRLGTGVPPTDPRAAVP